MKDPDGVSNIALSENLHTLCTWSRPLVPRGFDSCFLAGTLYATVATKRERYQELYERGKDCICVGTRGYSTCL